MHLTVEPSLPPTAVHWTHSTHIGGSDTDVGYGIAVAASGSAYVTGVTWSSGFPTVNPYQTHQGGWDAFVSKLSSVGSDLVYSTYLGGSGWEQANDIALDTTGCAYVTGATTSIDFPTVNPYHTDQGNDDVFVTKLSSAGNDCVYSTYLGGSYSDSALGIAVDIAGCTYVTGWTISTDFPIAGPYQTDQGEADAFVTKLAMSCCDHDGIRGDVNFDSQGPNIVDLTHVVAYLFSGGDPPPCPEEGDVNGDGLGPNIVDLTRLVDYLFGDPTGPPPAPCP